MYDNSELHNFTGDNSASVVNNSTKDLIVTLEQESQTKLLDQIAIDWFKTNETIVNPDEFQALIIRRNNPGEDLYKLNISGKDIILESNLKLLGIDIKLKDKLSFY